MMPTSPTTGDRLRHQAWEQQQAAHRARSEAAAATARRRAYQDALEAARRAVETGQPDAMRGLVHLVAREHRITVDERPIRPMAACAYRRARRILIAPIVDAFTFAIALHEVGHLLAEPCRGHRHQRESVPGRRRLGGCIACEYLAWQQAQRLAPFSRAMWAALRRGLDSYLLTTPAPARVRAEATHLRGDDAFARQRLDHLAARHRAQRLAANEAALDRVTQTLGRRTRR